MESVAKKNRDMHNTNPLRLCRNVSVGLGCCGLGAEAVLYRAPESQAGQPVPTLPGKAKFSDA